VTAPPRDDWNPYTVGALRDPYPHYHRLRGTAPVVQLRLDGRDVYAVTHDAHVRELLRHPRISNAGGISLHPRDRVSAGVIISSDGTDHDRLRKVLAGRMSRETIGRLEPQIRRQVHRVVSRLVRQRSFDAVSELARPVPTRTVIDLVGLPEEDRDQYPQWAMAAASAQGPADLIPPDRYAHLQTLRERVTRLGTDRRFTPGGLGAHIFAAHDRGEIDLGEATSLVYGALVVAGLHTTIAGLTWLLRLVAAYPDQWRRVTNASNGGASGRAWVDEVLRYEVMFPHDYRTTTGEVTVGGYTIPTGARVLLLLGAANRDPARWPEPDRFDPARARTGSQLGFGAGAHRCIGEHLFRAEATAVVDALASCAVTRIDAGAGEFDRNAAVRGWVSQPVTVHTAAS
jgi:hypothetical protein